MMVEGSFDELYHALVRRIRALGEHHEPRGLKCMELRPAVFSIDQARRGLYRGKSRRLNYRFFALETLCYLGGWGDQRMAQLLCRVNKNMAGFLNEEGYFDGAYGPRLIQSLPKVVEKLLVDLDSRQAVASIWSPQYPAASKDVPCTLSLHFYLNRTGAVSESLGMTATMRSNDINWGTPYDVAAFCAIQQVIAACIDIPVGKYTHMAGSLHMYENSPPTLVEYDSEKWWPQVKMPDPNVKGQLSWTYLLECIDDYLNAAHRHFCVDDLPAERWTHRLEVVTHPLINYFRSWGSLIRFGQGAKDA